ncbi:uncharacterized protein [Vicugna pacos]|uniref:Rab-GAP TBC domain-containing protein n=1 Tax=Vicugna pacos TaxID=30538 RepID=A0ABM5E115_VICPA
MTFTCPGSTHRTRPLLPSWMVLLVQEREVLEPPPPPGAELRGGRERSVSGGEPSDLEKLETILVSEWAEVTARYARCREEQLPSLSIRGPSTHEARGVQTKYREQHPLETVLWSPLSHVLVAYSVHNTTSVPVRPWGSLLRVWPLQEVSYRQGRNQVVAVLFMFLSEEDAFWALAQLVTDQKHIPCVVGDCCGPLDVTQGQDSLPAEFSQQWGWQGPCPIHVPISEGHGSPRCPQGLAGVALGPVPVQMPLTPLLVLLPSVCPPTHPPSKPMADKEQMSTGIHTTKWFLQCFTDRGPEAGGCPYLCWHLHCAPLRSLLSPQTLPPKLWDTYILDSEHVLMAMTHTVLTVHKSESSRCGDQGHAGGWEGRLASELGRVSSGEAAGRGGLLLWPCLRLPYAQLEPQWWCTAGPSHRPQQVLQGRGLRQPTRVPAGLMAPLPLERFLKLPLEGLWEFLQDTLSQPWAPEDNVVLRQLQASMAELRRMKCDLPPQVGSAGVST